MGLSREELFDKIGCALKQLYSNDVYLMHMASETGQVCANWRTAGRRLADSKNRDVNFLITAS